MIQDQPASNSDTSQGHSKQSFQSAEGDLAANSANALVELASNLVESAGSNYEYRGKSTRALKLTLVTPWKQECGNAEYAERLCVALSRFAEINPIDLRNFMDDFELRSSSSVRSYIDGLIASVNKQASDVVHLQHEYCFFGRSLQRSNSEFYRFAKQVKKPLVVTLHTWIDHKNAKLRKRALSFLKNPWDAIRALAQRKNLYNALCCCDAIVVHTHDTYTLVVTAFPKLRPKVRIIQIPIAPVEAGAHDATINKNEGDQWILLPGFVSPYKGHRYAVEALEKLPEQFKLVIAGGRHPKDRGAARYWMELLAEVEKKGLQSRVLFTGFLETGGVQAAVLKQADLFLLPYDEVGQSGSAVLADALAYNRPVVTSRARSMFAYRMSHDTVFACTSTDVNCAEKLAEVILNVCKESPANSEIELQRCAAMKRYSLDAIGSAYEQLYMDVRSKVG